MGSAPASPNLGSVFARLKRRVRTALRGRRESPAELIRGSSLFDAAWYFETYPEAAASGLDPVDHYLAVGAAQGLRPHPLFDSAWYLKTYEDVARAGQNPLVHYLLAGAAEGRRPNAGGGGTRDGEPLDCARLAAFKALGPVAGKRVAVVVAHAPDGRVRADAAAQVSALAEAGLAVVLVVAASRPFGPDPALTARLAGGYVREDLGFEIAAWAHVLRAEPRLFAADLLIVTDERWSGASGLADLLTSAERAPAPVVAAAGFIALKPPVLGSFVIHQALGDIGVVEDRIDVERLRSKFLSALQAGGFPCELLDDDPAFVEGSPDPAPSLAAGDWPLLEPPAAGATNDPPRVAFLGPWNYALGLGEGARGYMSALWRTGFDLNLHPVEGPFHVHARVTPTRTLRDFEGAADAALVNLNPDSWRFLTDAQAREVERARRRIGIFVWEMEEIPDSWRETVASVDAIWTPSSYCAEIFAKATDAPVHVIPHVVPVRPAPDPRRRAATLDAMGLPADARIILYAFDGCSFLERKNPDGLVRAFAASGLAETGWRLVVKTKNLMDQPEQGSALKRLIGEVPGVVLIDRSLLADEMTQLFEAADIYASPHRSEGFGLTIAEAMAQGKTVVATDFGGSRDFVDASCGYPVPARPTRLAVSYGPYSAGNTWADVDETEFAAHLSEAAGRIAAGDLSIGRAARARIARDFSAAAVGAAMRRALTDGLARPGRGAP